MDTYDVIIIGGGAAGLTASIYTRRKKLSTLVVSINMGGQTNLTEHIENYPGYLDLSGPKLMQLFDEQSKNFGTEFVFGKVAKLEKRGTGFTATLANGEAYKAKAVILAYGKVPRSLGIPGEEHFLGRGVSTCATCDMPLFNKKTVAIIGGGNSALEAAELGSKFCAKVYLIHRRNEFRGDPVTVDKIKAAHNVEMVLNAVPVEVRGDKFVKAMVIEDVTTKEKRELPVNGVFVEIGYITQTDFVKHLVELNKSNEILINEQCETRTPGLFACGDVTNVPYKQTIISAGQGAIAGLSAYNYLQKLEGKPTVKTDWA
ncbi:MAG: FAD-dependent oxidoreductase [Candidatus Aenigmarchaeota archaeon]|nr:FAD-dependent oxidoreductase [Candidatus Aenigmarchaeota archaeon]